MFNLKKKEDSMDNIRKQTIVLAKLNQLLDMQLYLTEQKVKLDKELKQLETEEVADKVRTEMAKEKESNHVR
jgi:hypothetical protein